MVRGRSFAGSSARRIGSLRKMVPQVLLRAENVACGRRFRRFFRWIPWKNLQKLLSLDQAEEPSSPSFAGTCGRTISSFFRKSPRKNTFFRYNTQRPLSHARKKVLLAEEPSSSTSSTKHHQCRLSYGHLSDSN